MLVAVINTDVISINRTHSPFGFQSLQGKVDGKNQEMTWCVPIKTTSGGELVGVDFLFLIGTVCDAWQALLRLVYLSLHF